MSGGRVICTRKQRGSMAERMRIQRQEPKPCPHPVACSFVRRDEQVLCPCYSAGAAGASRGPASVG